MDKDLWSNLKKEASKKADNVENLLSKASTAAKEKLGNIASLKTTISMENLDTLNVENKDKMPAIATAVNWLGQMMRKLRLRVEENRIALSGVFELLKENSEIVARMEDSLTEQAEEIREIKEEKLKDKDDMTEKVEELEVKLDEARQRGLKGNLIVSSPFLPAKGNKEARPSLPRGNLHSDPTKIESDFDYCQRMILQKTNIRISKEDIGACHSLPTRKAVPDTFVIYFQNRNAGSSWDLITSCMRSGKSAGGGSMRQDVNVFLNFQLTHRRAQLAKAIRQARFEKKIDRDSVNPNGQFRVKIGDKWEDVTSLAFLDRLTVARVSQPAGAAASAARTRTRRGVSSQ